jgi:hypothetical protein
MVPTQLNIDKVKKAVLKYAQTEDEDYDLHPEYLRCSFTANCRDFGRFADDLGDLHSVQTGRLE